MIVYSFLVIFFPFPTFSFVFVLLQGKDTWIYHHSDTRESIKSQKDMHCWFCKSGCFLGPVSLACHPAQSLSKIWDRSAESVPQPPCWVLGRKIAANPPMTSFTPVCWPDHCRVSTASKGINDLWLNSFSGNRWWGSGTSSTWELLKILPLQQHYSVQGCSTRVSAELALWPLEDFSSLQQPSWRTLHDKSIKLSGSWGHQPPALTGPSSDPRALPPAHRPGPCIRLCSRASHQLPTALPYLVMGTAKPDPPTCPCPGLPHHVPIPREMPDSQVWVCSSAPEYWALPCHPCHGEPPQPQPVGSCWSPWHSDTAVCWDRGVSYHLLWVMMSASIPLHIRFPSKCSHSCPVSLQHKGGTLCTPTEAPVVLPQLHSYANKLYKWNRNIYAWKKEKSWHTRFNTIWKFYPGDSAYCSKKTQPQLCCL